MYTRQNFVLTEETNPFMLPYTELDSRYTEMVDMDSIDYNYTVLISKYFTLAELRRCIRSLRRTYPTTWGATKIKLETATKLDICYFILDNTKHRLTVTIQ